MSQIPESPLEDPELEEMLRDALTAERAVPAHWREAAHAAYTWRTVDQELLALTYDSRQEGSEEIRSAVPDTATIEFSSGALRLEIELAGRRILGQTSAPAGSEVVVERTDGVTGSAVTDESGFFSFDDQEPGLLRLVVQVGDERHVTEWIAL